MSLSNSGPAFRGSWYGYERAQVDDFVQKSQAELRQLQERLSQAMSARSEQSLGDTTLLASSGGEALRSDAEREAEAIREQAEERARCLLDEAAADAQTMWAEREDASQRDLERVSRLRCYVATCLEVSDAALQDARRMVAAEAEALALTFSESQSVAHPDRSSWPLSRRLVAARAQTWSDDASERADPPCTRPFGHWPALFNFWRSGRSKARRLMHVAFALLVVSGAGHATRRGVLLESESDLPNASGLSEKPAISAAVGAPEFGSDSLVVTLTAQRACWIRALVDGGQRMERLMPPNETIVLHARERATLRVGDAGALLMLIGNRPVKPLGKDGEVVDLDITQANYASYLTRSAEAD